MIMAESHPLIVGDGRARAVKRPARLQVGWRGGLVAAWVRRDRKWQI